MYTMVDVKQYRENSDGTDLVVSVPGMKLGGCSRERRSRMQRSALMMGGISLRSRGRKHMQRSGILQTGQAIHQKK